MSVKKDPSGRRSIQVEVEVPGTPEQVWDAIATGPGISSWFVPCQVELGKDGKPAKMVLSFGPGINSEATVTAWEPPRRFSKDSEVAGPGSPTMATEWIVEARPGGTFIVRVVHSLFASTDEWDDQLKGTESGWPDIFRVLKLYLEHFRGQHGATMQVMVPAGGSTNSTNDAWNVLTDALGLTGAKAGQKCHTAIGAPALAGTVEHVGHGAQPSMMLRLEQPSPGIATLGAYSFGPQSVVVMVGFYLFGGQAKAVVGREETKWQQWLRERFTEEKS